jgi:arabinogalactan oligomer/maltooligosaccharide transport system substrate-binding protein
MKIKYTLFISLMVMVVLLLVACGGDDEEPTAAPAAEEAEQPAEEAFEEPAEEEMAGPSGTVSLWHSYHTGGAEEEAITQIIENARVEYPDLTIEMLQIPFDQIFNKWETEVAAGGGPDMFIAPNDDLGNLARSGLVMEIGDLLEGRLDGVVDTGIAGMKVGDGLYGVPESAKAVALYYNKSMVPDAPTTVEELMAIVEGGNVIVQNQNGYHLFGFWPAFGGQVLDDTGATACASGEEGFVDAMQYLLDLKNAGGLFETDGGKADTLFRQGEVPMIINGPWVLGDYRADLGDDLGVSPMPSATNPAGALNGIDGFYINPNSENAEGAVDLALFIVGTESAQVYTDLAGHVPIRTDVDAGDALVAAFAQASNVGTPRPQSESFGQYWGPFGDMITKVLEGVLTPEEGVAEACANFQTAIDG